MLERDGDSMPERVRSWLMARVRLVDSEEEGALADVDMERVWREGVSPMR